MGAGFEPAAPLQGLWFSRPAHSSTLPSHRSVAVTRLPHTSGARPSRARLRPTPALLQNCSVYFKEGFGIGSHCLPAARPSHRLTVLLARIARRVSLRRSHLDAAQAVVPLPPGAFGSPAAITSCPSCPARIEAVLFACGLDPHSLRSFGEGEIRSRVNFLTEISRDPASRCSPCLPGKLAHRCGFRISHAAQAVVPLSPCSSEFTSERARFELAKGF